MPQQPHGESPHAPDECASDGRDVMTLLDVDATIGYVSPSIEPILGYKPEQEEALTAAVQRCEQLERSRRWNMELIATLSHELRTPLNVIVGYHDLLLDGTFGALTSEQSYTIRRAQRSAQELLDIMSATLDLTRLDGGHVRLITQTVATADLFEELSGDLRQLCDKPGVTLQWNVAANTPKIVTDPAKLKMIVKHLVRNALQVTNHGAVAIEVRPDYDGLEIAIADHGAGASHAAMTTIFGAQQQPHPSVLAGFGGSGLGLYAARQLVEILGGNVAVETDRATGSTVRIFLPPCAMLQQIINPLS